MAGRKRASDDSGPTTRSSKTAKTDASATPKSASKGHKKGPKANLGTSAFKARALPLHVNITHTPPPIADTETVAAVPVDPGFVGSLSLVPSSFTTGSYGWKGNKRITVELQNPEGGEDKEKVHVMLTINATVVGSKGAKDGEEGEKEDGHAEELHVEEARAEEIHPEETEAVAGKTEEEEKADE